MTAGITVNHKRFFAVASVLLLVWLGLYKDALIAMESIWSRSDTFAHGYFIFPISFWLFWRDREALLQAQFKQSWLPLPFLIGALTLGVFSYAADISVLSQLSAIASLITLVWLLIGNKLAWRYKFPLAFLLFSVPMGESLIPWLQDVTAWFTVAFLKMNGIPVFRDGLYIQVPTGMFEVAVACSGIRYLIASVAVGTLYAYLTYNKPYKQWLFVSFAIVLPILANGIRAYGIVAIAYYSDMKYATGADHLVYGWVFFGVVIMIMFWIGGFFADSEQSKEKFSVNQQGQVQYLPLAVALLALFGSYILLKAIPVVELPSKQSVSKEKLASTWGIKFEDPLQMSHIKTQKLEIYRAEYANKQTKGELITWQNVTHNPEQWTEVANEEVEIANNPAKLVHLRSINGDARSYLYQYKIGDFYTFSKRMAKLMQAWNSLSRRSDYSEIRAISVADAHSNDVAKALLIRAFTKAQAQGGAFGHTE
ncbi:exosortase A [Litorilituus lipolyticus]|uniref:Exosortase A n=1 Tax=Litorilituus lipolyticus TaxID=2491017 RepID=A0A502KSZ1_9GAMM|nr:exosortase A [Litorilituus lipolyticus]TPH13285.1 exosortase A [Litorilituus lipolyticus]